MVHPYIMGIVRGLSMIWSGGGTVCVEGNSGSLKDHNLHFLVIHAISLL